MGRKILFTDREKDFIRRFSSIRSGNWMAKKLGVSYCVVYRFMDREGLKKLGARKALSIQWTDEMITILKKEFPVTFNRDLAARLNMGMRSLIRKARELGIEKEPGFLEKRRAIISKLAAQNHPPPWNKGLHFNPPWLVPTQIKKGESRKDKVDYKAIADRRKELIRKERLRMKYGLPRKTKIRLKL